MNDALKDASRLQVCGMDHFLAQGEVGLGHQEEHPERLRKGGST